MAEVNRQYFKSIDGLRFFASVSVVLYHYEKMGGFNNLHGSPDWFFRILKGPAFHASLFFILAGFLFTIKYSKAVSEFSTAVFIKSRLKQLYPLHVISTLIMVPFILQNDSLFSGKLWISLFMHLSFLWPFYPFGTYTMNMPSWALGAFFFCYLLFKPALKFVNKINSKRETFFYIVLSFFVLLAWGILYKYIHVKNDHYFFFHAFPPIRFFEFLQGMLVAKFFLIRSDKKERGVFASGWFNDVLIALLLGLIYVTLLLRTGKSEGYQWFSYHFILPIIFVFLLYRLARGTGYIAKFMALPIIRNLGKSSFYPYLLHIPIMSWFCQILERNFAYKKFLHSPLNVSTFVFLLYMISMLYVLYLRKRPASEFRRSYE